MHIDRTSAERQRRYRQRQSGKLCYAPVEITYTMVIALVERGYLSDGESADPICRARAVEQFLTDQLFSTGRYTVTG